MASKDLIIKYWKDRVLQLETFIIDEGGTPPEMGNPPPDDDDDDETPG